MNPLLLKAAGKAAPYVIAVAIAGGWLVSHNAKQRALGAAAVRDSINAVAIAALRTEAAQLAAGMARLRADSATLASQGVQTAATFRRELARWRALAGRVDTVEVAGDSTSTIPNDSIPTLAAVIQQANRTIASCQLNTANCEQRAANAEARVVTADSQRTNAEKRSANFEQQTKDMKKLIPSSRTAPLRTARDVAMGWLLKIGYDAITKKKQP